MANREEVAIVGYAARVPGAKNVEGFWRLLRDNRQTVSWISEDRFPVRPFYHPDSDQRGRSYTFAAGVIDDLWGFDAAAFGISPREAEQVDPQQRHLLEVTHDALAHAGIRPSTLAGTDAGVFVGASSVDHIARLIADPSACDMYLMTGNTLSIMANRISYNLDVHGPSFTVDTACSSSLVALNLAAEAIRAGQIDTAIVGGVNLLLSPFSYIGFSRASMLSPTGRCRPFDAAADGYVRSEGAIVVVLRSMAAARKARNHVHAVIVGSGVNQDGRTTGLSLPSTEAQRSLLEKVYSDFSVDPSDLSFFEAHGTGTKVGDPLEANAIGKALAQRRSQPLPIGSVKSNIGHLEPASGLAGLLKTVLALRNGLVPATLHQQSPNPNIAFDELNVRVVERNLRLPDRRGPALAGVNSFGFGGTNAHVIVASGDSAIGVANARHDVHVAPLLISAHSPAALTELADAYQRDWPSDRGVAKDFILAAAHLRDPLAHRLLVLGGSTDEVRRTTEQFVRGEASAAILTGQALGNDLDVAYLFSGNGSQWAGMGREAWESGPRFRKALTDVASHFERVQNWSIVDLLFADDLPSKLRFATYSQPLLFALQAATVRVLEDYGVTPAATLGHSVGEIGAAWAAGTLSLDQAIEIVSARSRHQEIARSAGTMAALMLSEREALNFLERAGTSGVDIAAINSPRSVTVSGPHAEIQHLLSIASERRISARALDLDYPFHSSLIDSVRAPLLRELDGLKPLETRRRFFSSVTGGEASSLELGPDHWWRNVREPVRFEPALTAMIEAGSRIFVEIGPRAILGSYVRDVLRATGVRGVFLDTLKENDQESSGDCLEHSVSRILLAGGHVELQRFFGPPPVIGHSLPLYPWQHTQFQVRSSTEASNVFGATTHALLGSRPKADTNEWYGTVDSTVFPWLLDHKVGDVAVFPATGFVEIILAAAKEVYGDFPLEISNLDILRPFVFEANVSFDTRLTISVESGLAEYFSRPRGVTEWGLNAKGFVGRSPISHKDLEWPVEPQGTVVVPHEQLYKVTQDIGFYYGPTFRRIKQASFLSSACMTTTLVEADKDLLDSYLTDFSGLDAALHGLFASEEGGITYLPVSRMMPTRFARVRLLRPGATATKSVTWTIRRSATSTLVDIDLVDESGEVVLAAEGVRLMEAPADIATIPSSVSYRTTEWASNRPGLPGFGHLTPTRRSTVLPEERVSYEEATLLLEAGYLRASWETLRKLAADSDLSLDATPEGTASWWVYLRAALLEWLGKRGLAFCDAGIWRLASECTLPPLESLVTSLVARHPTMAVEAAGLTSLAAYLDKLFEGGDKFEPAKVSTHWRALEDASSQVHALRRSAIEEIALVLEQAPPDHLSVLLAVGAVNIDSFTALCTQFPNVEIIVTDPASERLDQAKASLGDNVPRVQFVRWGDLANISGGTVDLAVIIDVLGEATAAGHELETIRRLMRPQAPLILAELGPSLFWDVARGSRPSWWKRSVDPALPVSALLSTLEWLDELQATGFSSEAVEDAASGNVLIRSLAPSTIDSLIEERHPARAFSWHDPSAHAGASRNGFLAVLAAELSTRLEAHPAVETVTDIVWALDATETSARAEDFVTESLSGFADLCRQTVNPARVWVLARFSSKNSGPLAEPLWCSIASALRVAQNEYGHLEMHCVGIAGELTSQLADDAVGELLYPSHEREVFLYEGRRLVFRAERGATLSSPSQMLAEDQKLRLANRRRTNREALAWVADIRRAPRLGEVEIEVAASGLNFRDVMWNLRLLPEEALEDGYAGAGFGMECAGTITRVGSDSENFAIGDRVFAFVPGAFASHVIAPSFAVCKLPGQISLESAATIPVAFLTAYYSLVHLARLGRDETILIHGGAGAVGLAALQIAKLVGARAICTAGSESKRSLLLDLGAEFVSDSRSLSFADDVSRFTDGRGVDVVLNSLAGEAMARSVDCLKPFGRFVELGKRDFYANTLLGLRPFRRNLAYFGVDVDQLIKDRKDLATRLFAELANLFEVGQLRPLPYRAFAAEQIADAFKLMQHSGHIGKIVVTAPRKESVPAPASLTFPVSSKGVHVIVGGTGGFGLATAEWLAARGARSLYLVSRSGKATQDSLEKIAALRSSGVQVETAAVDVCDEEQVVRMLQRAERLGAVKGVIHAAMVLDDGLIEGMDLEAISRVVRPKIQGALNLANATKNLALDYLLLYSSATTLFGNPGQYNYVGANAYLEGLARQLHERGRPVLAVGWGAIEDAGFLARNMQTDEHLKRRFAGNLLTARRALDGLDWAFDAEGQQLTAAFVLAKIDWAAAKRDLVAIKAPLFTHLTTGSPERQTSGTAELIEELKDKPFEEAVGLLEELVVEQIALVLRQPPREIDRHRALAEIGMDSLMMLELRCMVEDVLHIELPMMSLASGISPADVARRIVPLVRNDNAGGTITGTVAALSASHIGDEASGHDDARTLAAAEVVISRARQLDGPL